MKVTAIVAAAGSGSRLGNKTPKQFITVAGCPVLVHALRAFEEADTITDVVLVIPSDPCGSSDGIGKDGCGFEKLRRTVIGGATRQESVGRGLAAIDWPADLAAIHDAARCLVTPELIDSTVAACEGWDGAVAALPVRDTLKRVEGEKILTTEPREGLWAMQTPQVFRFPMIRKAYEKAASGALSATDDAAVAEAFGARVRIVSGGTFNFKITQGEDLEIAEALLRYRKERGCR